MLLQYTLLDPVWLEGFGEASSGNSIPLTWKGKLSAGQNLTDSPRRA